jgi:Ni/Fe-hydrogenase 1 B-type cytochrome subunit
MLMALTRGVHFFAAGILMITVVLRLLGMFFGPYRDWSFFIGSSEDLKLMPKVIAHYLHLGPMPELKKKYNPLQMITYSGAFLFIIFQIISGFALLYPEGWFGWFNYGLFNNEIEARLAHYIVTWVFLLFLMIHVYLGVREGLQEMKEVHLMRRSEEVER